MALVVDTCDLVTGTVQKVTAVGRAQTVALDRDRAMRKFTRYLGADQTAWDPRFVASLAVRGIGMIRLKPDKLVARDVSFTPAS